MTENSDYEKKNQIGKSDNEIMFNPIGYDKFWAQFFNYQNGQ